MKVTCEGSAQVRCRAGEAGSTAKKSSAYLKEDTALSASTKKALEGTADFSDDVVAGDLSSAYAAQQMTSNIVVERKKDQGRIESLYGKTIKAAPPQAGPGAGRRHARQRARAQRWSGQSAHDGRR